MVAERRRLRLNLLHLRKGKQLEAVETYYVLGRKSAGRHGGPSRYRGETWTCGNTTR